MLLLFQVRVLEGIYILKLLESEGAPCSNRRNIQNLSDSNKIQTHNHLVRK